MYSNIFTYSCALSLALCLGTGCGKKRLNSDELPAPSGRFSEVTGEYPGVVMVIAPNNGLCTGTFISERAVLTASHCTQAEGRYQVYSSFGTFTSNTVVSFGPGVVDDPNDIAVIILDEDVASRDAGQVYDIGDSLSLGDEVRLVGYGCSDVNTRRGAGIKRTGTNVVAYLGEYIEFSTPLMSSGARSIIGPENRSGSCFGDSGGPSLKTIDGSLKVVGVTHAGGSDGDDQISQYINIATSGANKGFLRQVNGFYDLGIEGL